MPGTLKVMPKRNRRIFLEFWIFILLKKERVDTQMKALEESGPVPCSGQPAGAVVHEVQSACGG